MPLVSLTDAFRARPNGRGALAGVVVLGWEDAQAYVQAAETVGCPIILQAGPGCRRHTPLPVLAAMFRHLADAASVPVVAHLDHGETPEACFEGIDAGFSSVMYDGSALPLVENIAQTRKVLERAHPVGVSVEAELGIVGYIGETPSIGTQPEEARTFYSEAPVDALAISAGNTHLSRSATVPVDETVIAAIDAAVTVPLVLHGASGIPRYQRRRLALDTKVAKFNIGTELRQTFGRTLRRVLNEDPNIFDRNAILNETIGPMSYATATILRDLLP